MNGSELRYSAATSFTMPDVRKPGERPVKTPEM